MRLVLGIDTGGTYTNAAIMDYDSGEVVDKSAALTTRHDLSIGVAGALARLPKAHLATIRLVSLSTTLATNAIVEGQGGRVCLLLLGYDPRLLETYGLQSRLGVDDYLFLPGGFDLQGEEVEPLDLDAVSRAVDGRKDVVDAFAVSGYFSVRNPLHEIQVKRLIAERTGIPVVCGHELTGELDSITRATTAAVNARLIPLLKRLIKSVQRVMSREGVAAPLVVVKGDGSLMSVEEALERPVETVLSGPAASAIGARHLAGQKDCVVVDLGGTTTDIAVLADGLPKVSVLGANVGRWRTFVRAVDTRTAGIGGDSYIKLHRDGRLLVGPRRVVPLCRAAASHPEITSELARISRRSRGNPGEQLSDFLFLERQPERAIEDPRERRLADYLAIRPRSMLEIIEELKIPYVYLRDASYMERLGVIGRIGLTPTDTLHVEGAFRQWDREAALLGCQMMADRLGVRPEQLLELVKKAVVGKICTEILVKVIGDGTSTACSPTCELCAFLIKEAAGGEKGGLVDCSFELKRPIVAIGAPVNAYFPVIARRFKARLVVPQHYEVGNAVGAAASQVVRTVDILIRPVISIGSDTVAFTLHSPEERAEFSRLDRAIEHATARARALAEREAARAGAEKIELRTEVGSRYETLAPGEKVFLETRIRCTAVGRPALPA